MIQNADVTSLVPITKFTAHQTYITRVLLSPDVRHLATCSADHTARIWAVDPFPSPETNGTNGAVTNGHHHNANGAHHLTNGATTNGHMPTMNGIGHASGAVMAPESTKSFPLETTLHGHQRWVWDCAFSADSAYLVTACSDHFARLWELSSQSIIRQYNGHHRGAVCVALNDTAHPA